MTHNTPQTIAWFLVGLLILGIIIWVEDFYRDRKKKRIREFYDAVEERRNDNAIFKTVEEARRDFS